MVLPFLLPSLSSNSLQLITRFRTGRHMTMSSQQKLAFHERINVDAERVFAEELIRRNDRPKILDLTGFTHEDAERANIRDYRLIDVAKTPAFIQAGGAVVHDVFAWEVSKFLAYECSSFRESGKPSQDAGWLMMDPDDGQFVVRSLAEPTILQALTRFFQIQVFTECVLSRTGDGLAMVLEPTHFIRFDQFPGDATFHPGGRAIQPNTEVVEHDPFILEAVSRIMIQILLHEIAVLQTETNRDGTILQTVNPENL